MKEEMKKTIFSRYKKHNIKFKTWEELKEAIQLDDTKDITCFYCGKELEANGKKYPFNVISLDHKHPKHWGGKDTIENTCLCCNECNIVKGTMEAETFQLLIECLKNCGIQKRVFKEAYPGKRANMLERKKKAKKIKCLSELM